MGMNARALEGAQIKSYIKVSIILLYVVEPEGSEVPEACRMFVSE